MCKNCHIKNHKYITYCTVIRGRLNHVHTQHAQQNFHMISVKHHYAKRWSSYTTVQTKQHRVIHIRGSSYLSGSSDTSLSLATSDSGPNMTTGRTKPAEIYTSTQQSTSYMYPRIQLLSWSNACCCISNLYLITISAVILIWAHTVAGWQENGQTYVWLRQPEERL